MDETYTEPLTRREQQVAELAATGLHNREIAMKLGISPETVKRHLSVIYDKLALHSRVGLAIHMMRTRSAGIENVTSL